MLKKLTIAAVAVLVGLLVVKHTEVGSLLRVWWKDARAGLDRQIPVEVKIKQLKAEIDKIDQDIKKNLSRLAKQEAEFEQLQKRVASLRKDQKVAKADISEMMGLLKKDTEQVSFDGRTCTQCELKSKLESTVANYNTRKEQLKSLESLLTSKKKTLAIAHQQLQEIRTQKDQMLQAVAKFEAQNEENKLRRTEAKTAFEFDGSHLNRCKELSSEIDQRLLVEQKELDLQAKYGYGKATASDKPAKSNDEVLKSAQKALEDDHSDVLVDKK